MKILVIGSGGREHALVWKLKQSPRVKEVLCAPGNAGIAETRPVKADDVEGLFNLALREKIDLTVVGPEVPLTLGIVDRFQKEGLQIFGPNRDASQLEGSKVWTKRFLEEFGVPTARFETFEDVGRAAAYLEKQSYPLVVKADGLASGKGVVIAHNQKEATEALEGMLKKFVFGEAGRKVVIEEFLKGEEASLLAFVDGKTILPLEAAQDHKRVGEGDRGLNTGGMGAYSPAPVVTESVRQAAMDRILVPTLRGLAKRGIEFRGILYAGLMVTAEGPKLLEYNVRFGDPETQPLLMRLDEDLVEVMEATCHGKLSGRTLRWKSGASVCVVMAAHGYPGEIRTGDEIHGLAAAESIPETVVFHAGTKQDGGRVLTAGGRVLGVTSWGRNLRLARERAYDACDKIHWAGVHYRKDIGLKATGGRII